MSCTTRRSPHRLGAGTPFSGRAALSRYVAGALERYPDLHFGPDLLVAAGSGSVAIAYRSVEDLMAIETLELDDNRRVSTARCHYRQAPTGRSPVSSSDCLTPLLPLTAHTATNSREHPHVLLPRCDRLDTVALIFWSLGRPASVYIEAMSKRPDPRRQPACPSGLHPNPGCAGNRGWPRYRTSAGRPSKESVRREDLARVWTGSIPVAAGADGSRRGAADPG